MNHYSESNQEVLRECPESIDGLLRELESIFEAPWGFKCTCGSDPEGHCDFCSEYEKARIKAKKLIVQWNTRTTPQEPPKHCSTCKHFKRIYPENYQLGVCEYLEVTDLQPCGHMIDRPPIASDKFVSKDKHPICVNRMMDSFGCVYHCPKEEGGDVKMKRLPTDDEIKDKLHCPEQQSVPSKGDEKSLIHKFGGEDSMMGWIRCEKCGKITNREEEPKCHCPIVSNENTELKSAEDLALEIAREELAAHESDVNLFHPDFQDGLQKLIKQIQLNAFKAGMTEAAETVQYWKSGHESRLRTFPNNCCIKSEIKDCEELRRVILAARDATNTI